MGELDLQPFFFTPLLTRLSQRFEASQLMQASQFENGLDCTAEWLLAFGINPLASDIMASRIMEELDAIMLPGLAAVLQGWVNG